MQQHMVPILTQDQSTFDWPEATYTPTVNVTRTTATVRNSVKGADALSHLVAQQKARWAIEARCPRTLMARTTIASDSGDSVTAKWDEADIDLELGVAIIPGLVAVDNCELHSEHLTDVWKDTAANGLVAIPAGAWLARGNVHWLRPRIASLLRFHRADEHVEDGQMIIQRPTTSDALIFHVYLAEDVYPRWRDRDIWHIALVGACAQLPDTGADWDDESPAKQDLHSLRSQLQEAGVDLWDGDGQYDPAFAATVIEPLLAHDTLDEDIE